MAYRNKIEIRSGSQVESGSLPIRRSSGDDRGGGHLGSTQRRCADLKGETTTQGLERTGVGDFRRRRWLAWRGGRRRHSWKAKAPAIEEVKRRLEKGKAKRRQQRGTGVTVAREEAWGSWEEGMRGLGLRLLFNLRFLFVRSLSSSNQWD